MKKTIVTLVVSALLIGLGVLVMPREAKALGIDAYLGNAFVELSTCKWTAVTGGTNVTVTGAVADTIGYIGRGVAILGIEGGGPSNDNYATFALQESSDNSTFTYVTNTELSAVRVSVLGGGTTGVAVQTVFPLEREKTKRYLRTILFATNGVDLSVHGYLIWPQKYP